MRLPCQKALFLIISTIACHNSTGPRTIDAQYALQTINDRQLPTYLAPTPGPTATIFWSTLTLDKAGKAVMAEHRRVEPPLTEGTYTYTYDYRINGNLIEIGSFQPCPANANCAPNRVGTIFGSTLRLSINPGSQFHIVYEYRIAPTL